MQRGMSLEELAREITRIEDQKMDLVVPTAEMRMESNNGDTGIVIGGHSDKIFRVRDIAHGQIAERLKIPRAYYNRMREQDPDLLAYNVNRWMEKSPERRLVRVLDGDVRAYLSDRYQIRDNYPLASVALPILQQQPGIQVVSSNITESNMYLQVITDELQGEVRVGETVKAGIMISNSEVGMGALEVSLFIYVLACMNGMLREHSFKKYHIGRRITEEDLSGNIYRQETIAANQHAFLMAAEDTLRHAFDRDAFYQELEKFQAAARNEMPPNRIDHAIENVTKRFNLSQEEGETVKGRLLDSLDFTQWGMAQAVTNLTNDEHRSYDAVVNLERIGGQIIDLQPSEWRQVIAA